MKEPIFPTCTGDDGQRIYLIFSPSPILDLSWNISRRYLFLRSRFLLQTKRNGVHLHRKDEWGGGDKKKLHEQIN